MSVFNYFNYRIVVGLIDGQPSGPTNDHHGLVCYVYVK